MLLAGVLAEQVAGWQPPPDSAGQYLWRAMRVPACCGSAPWQCAALPAAASLQRKWFADDASRSQLTPACNLASMQMPASIHAGRPLADHPSSRTLLSSSSSSTTNSQWEKYAVDILSLAVRAEDYGAC